MKTVINIKTDKDVKEQAVRTARDMGIPLSTVMNAFLKKFIYDKSITFHAPYAPSKKLAAALKRAQKDIRQGKNISPFFDDMDTLDRYLADL